MPVSGCLHRVGLAVYVFQGAFPQMAVSYFHMSKDQLGVCLTYVALVTLVSMRLMSCSPQSNTLVVHAIVTFYVLLAMWCYYNNIFPCT